MSKHMMTLAQKYEEMIDLYNEIKEEIRRKDRHKFEQWKAGGFLVDDDTVSMYPALGQVVEYLTEDEDEDEDSDED